MKNNLFRILAYLIVLTFLFQPIQTLANSSQVEISDNSSMAVAQTPAPGEPYGEQFEKEFEMEIEAERQRILEEHLREEGMPEELLRYEYGSNPQERPEYVPPSEEVIAQTKAQVDSFSCASVTDVPVIECEALVAIYQSTNGAGWTNKSNWLATNTVGNWYGIAIESGHITTINLYDNNLIGSIPPEIGNLSILFYLYLSSNQLSGSIPPEIGNLSNLRRLGLNDNQLSGSIPSELGNLSSLYDLILWTNQLSGSIPAELGNLSNLEWLRLDDNHLSGSIPLELGNLSDLKWLFLDNNQLSGSIPAELGNLSNLRYLVLDWNQLSDSIPPELGNLSNLAYLDLSINQLSGSIPVELGNLSILFYLYLSNNQLSGSIPPALGNLSNLYVLSLHDNQLSGSIPTELGNLSNLELLVLDNNQLSGSIPLELGNLSNLWKLELHSNQLSGSIPPELGNLSNLIVLDLSGNQLSGSIPLSFINLVYLDEFYFYDTLLCEPDTPEFLAWKETVNEWGGTDIICPLNVDIGFRAVPDGYGFVNWGSINLSDFTFTDLIRMFGTDAVCWKVIDSICILKPKAELFVYQVNIPMAGHCLGMAVSSLRFYNDIDLPLSLEEVFFLGKDSAVLTNWQSETISTTIRRNISYFHVMQQADPFASYSDESMKNLPSQILYMVSSAMSGTEENYPILFFYRTDMKGGHAVTPYAVEDKGNGIYWIRIYDNNFPGYHDKKIIVDINNETWYYTERYNGDRFSHNLGTAPISIFAQRPVCPWCVNTLNTIPTIQLTHQGAGELLIQDSLSRRLGYQDGVFYSEIPGAYAQPVLGGLDIDTQPIFYLPLTDEYSLTLAGLPTKSVGEASIVAFGPGYGITINGIDVDSMTMDVISISNDGSTINYQPNQDQDISYGLYLDTENASWQLETSQVDVSASHMSVITVDPSQKFLEIDNFQNTTGEYNLYFKRVSDDDTDYFASNEIEFTALSSHYVHFDGWQTTGTVQCDIDENGDGDPDETVYLENQLKMLYLPVIWH